MTEVFQKRRSAFLVQTSRYLRYVFNDHFVLVLVFLFGFLMVQYSQLLRNFPKNHWSIILILVLMTVVLLGAGRIGTYLEPADKQFLLPKETEVLAMIRKAKTRSYVVWTAIQTILLVFLAPIFLKLGLSLVMFVLLLVVLGVVKWFIFAHKSGVFYTESGLDWDAAIAYEQKRKQSILKFFALFTNVKGISTSVKRRAYLDDLLKRQSKTQATLWSNLYARAFLRSGDYLALTLRLGILSLVLIVLISSKMIGAGLALIFNYLLLFQLLALFNHFDYQYMVHLYPVSGVQKVNNLQDLLRLIAYSLMVLQALALFSLKPILLLVVVTIVLTEVYLPYKMKKMID